MPTDKNQFQSVGADVTIYDPVVLIRPDLMVLKSNIIISEFAFLAAGMGLYVGNYIHISAHSIISGGGYCILEDFVGLSPGVSLITGSENLDGSGLTNPTIPDEFRSVNRSFVHCEKHVFLATNVIVHPGVTIGEGTVVGSGSVVTKNLEPWSIYVGTPAKKIKDRPKDIMLEMEDKLLSSRNIEPSDFSQALTRIKEMSP